MKQVAPAAPSEAFPYEGPAELRQPVAAALGRVIDPEVALNIVDIGLVYGVAIAADRCHVRLTMTSAACPVAEVIIDEACRELALSLPAAIRPDIEIVWEPAWTPDMMSERGRRFMEG
jgi:metal-sulfur cluster biosynthetic enzyme